MSSIYSSCLPYYVYAYLRKNGTPYYIGKGHNKRAWQKSKGHIPPKNKSRIVLIESNLTEMGAFALERFYIRWYGRKDLGTGILHNKTDGGEGSSGLVHSEKTKKTISEKRQGRKITEHHKNKLIQGRKNKLITDDFRKKMSELKKGKYFSESHKQNISKAKINKPLSSKHKENVSKSLKGIPKRTIQCPHCNKIGGISTMKQWHFTKCKFI